MSHTFDLGLKITPSLQLNTAPSPNTATPKEILPRLVGTAVEQTCQSTDVLIAGAPPNLAGLAHQAYANHHHMILDPDTVWITIERGLATHITENAEALRHLFVNFEGKKTIDIRRDTFQKGGVNDWENCFDEFSEKIGGEIGSHRRDLIVSDFSTTTRLQKVSSEIVLMDAMSQYFDYAVYTLCSIPRVTLEGTVEDWENIRDRVRTLSEFDLNWWTDELLPVMDQLVRTAQGHPELDFWAEWYKVRGGSGGPFISGHVKKFFPYHGRHTPQRADFMDLTMDQIPHGFSQVPFVWNYYSSRYPMEFLGGIIGVAQDANGAVRGAFGWSVREAAVMLTHYPWEEMTLGMTVHHQDGRVGSLRQVEAHQYPDGSRRICSVDIDWGNGTPVTQYDYDKLYVVEVNTEGP